MNKCEWNMLKRKLSRRLSDLLMVVLCAWPIPVLSWLIPLRPEKLKWLAFAGIWMLSLAIARLTLMFVIRPMHERRLREIDADIATLEGRTTANIEREE